MTYEDFDTNKFAFGITQPEFNELLKNERKPLVNKFLSGQYSPGSVIKPIIALSALENKIVDQDYTHFCGGKIELYGQEFYCWKDGGHGKVNLRDAIKRANAYLGAGADGIMIHSKSKNPKEIFEFAKQFRKDFKDTPLICVPSTYNQVTENELLKKGVYASDEELVELQSLIAKGKTINRKVFESNISNQDLIQH